MSCLQTLTPRRSSNYTDELTWGALWLHKATGDNSYLSDAESTYITGPAWGFSWDEKLAGNKVIGLKKLYLIVHV